MYLSVLMWLCWHVVCFCSLSFRCLVARATVAPRPPGWGWLRDPWRWNCNPPAAPLLHVSSHLLSSYSKWLVAWVSSILHFLKNCYFVKVKSVLFSIACVSYTGRGTGYRHAVLGWPTSPFTGRSHKLVIPAQSPDKKVIIVAVFSQSFCVWRIIVDCCS